MSTPAGGFLDPTTIITSAIGEVTGALTGVAGPAVAVGAGVVALGVAWRVAKKFVKVS